MKTNNVLGIVFANVHDDFIHDLTKVRSMASVPFGARYRIIDFSLSNLVNAGVSKVGVVPKSNYHSLMDHLGSGKPWDLDRKSGGLSILPPYVNSEVSLQTGHIDSLSTIMSYLRGSKETYVVMCDADVVSNMDIGDMLQQHISKKADVTIAYKTGPLPRNDGDIMTFSFAKNGRIEKILLSQNTGMECAFSLDVVIISRERLIQLVQAAKEENATRIWRDVFLKQVDTLHIYGYEITGAAFVIDGTDSYANANFALLQPEVRQEVFDPTRPVYTKTRDDVPTKYGLSARVKNSLIADGAVVDGEVTDCVIFRGVHIEKGAVLKNCIIMQDSIVRKDAKLTYVIADKDAEITEGRSLCGAPTQYMFVHKKAKV